MNDILLFTRYINRAIIATAIAIAVLSVAACRSSHTVNSESVRTVEKHDTIRLTQYSIKRDSVYLHDSVYLEVRGDTVRYTFYRDRWHFSTDTLHDTVYVSKQGNDSIATTHTETTVTQTPQSLWSRMRDWFIGACICFILGVGIMYYLRAMRRYTNDSLS